MRSTNTSVGSSSAMAGLFISFEGIDGAGKSTHIAAVAQALRDAGRTVTETREPGGTDLAEKLRQLILHEPMDGLTEALLVFAARRDHLLRVIEPALARGEVVLSDRFTDATFAYQGGGRGFDEDVLSYLESQVQAYVPPAGGSALREPNLTVWFDVAPEIAAQRLADARQPDKFEAQDTAFFARVVQGYTRRYAQSPGRFARINAAQSPQEVRTVLLDALRQRGYLP